MLPSNRWARFDYYMQLYDRQLIDQVEVLKQTEVVDIEGVLNRFNQIKTLQEQLQSASLTIKQLQGDLQTAQRESVQDRKRVEVTKFAAKLKSGEADMKAKSQIFSARLDDELTKQEALTSDAESQAEQSNSLTL
jgi:TolA-binding protein